jgi:hypothetical protein
MQAGQAVEELATRVATPVTLVALVRSTADELARGWQVRVSGQGLKDMSRVYNGRHEAPESVVLVAGHCLQELAPTGSRQPAVKAKQQDRRRTVPQCTDRMQRAASGAVAKRRLSLQTMP